MEDLIKEFNKLPGIGHKTAERFVYHLLKQPPSDIEAFARALEKLKAEIQLCPQCFDFSKKNPCLICQDAKRDNTLLCIVAEGSDIQALEKTKEYPGRYFVLGGTINQIEGIGPEELRFSELLKYLKQQKNVREIILALNANMEGETTAMYLSKELKPLNIKITRLARGLPMGSDIEYADEVTLASALQGRNEI